MHLSRLFLTLVRWGKNNALANVVYGKQFFRSQRLNNLLSTLSLFTLKGTVMQNEKTQMNDRLSV